MGCLGRTARQARWRSASPRRALCEGRASARPAAALLSGFTDQITPATISAGSTPRHDGIILAALPSGGVRVWAVTGTSRVADPAAPLPTISAPALLPTSVADDPAAALPGGLPLPPSVGGGCDRAAPKRRLAALTLGPQGRWWGVVPAVARVGTGDAAATSVAAAWFELRVDVAADGAEVELSAAATGVVGVLRGGSLLAPSIAPLADGRGALLTAVHAASDAGPWLVAALVGADAAPKSVFIAAQLGAAATPPRPNDAPVAALSDPAPPPPVDSVVSTAAASDGVGVWLVGQAPACGGSDARVCDARGELRVARVVL